MRNLPSSSKMTSIHRQLEIHRTCGYLMESLWEKASPSACLYWAHVEKGWMFMMGLGEGHPLVVSSVLLPSS